MSQSPALVSWDKVCLPKTQGGLGICDLRRWNAAVVGKYVWWLMNKKDHLWVKWVHCVYLKGVSWHDYKPSQGSSWVWKRICRIKERFLAGYVSNGWLSEEGEYNIAKGYQWLGTSTPAVNWYKCIWNNFNIPKQQFIGWLWIQGRLLTKDMLCCMGIGSDMLCELCGDAAKSHEHLFFGYVYSKKCLQLVNVWCHSTIPSQQLLEWWLGLRQVDHKEVLVAVLLALLYHLWWARNHCRVTQMVWSPEVILGVLRVM
ncbi:uncharacterized protein LOC141641199 [Silene latifolia]|uniref:uncharacterized protein LOC141641199 n=1 Tax=Silene latifolia TaxID=37657 RepID=UPI003D771A83